jgi:hypothetical protein
MTNDAMTKPSEYVKLGTKKIGILVSVVVKIRGCIFLHFGTLPYYYYDLQ